MVLGDDWVRQRCVWTGGSRRRRAHTRPSHTPFCSPIAITRLLTTTPPPLAHAPRTSGNATYTFARAKLAWPGVARSITFAPPVVAGKVSSFSLALDNVAVLAPTGEAAALAAGKARVVEAALVAKADAVRALVADKVADLTPDLDAKEEEGLVKSTLMTFEGATISNYGTDVGGLYAEEGLTWTRAIATSEAALANLTLNGQHITAAPPSRPVFVFPLDCYATLKGSDGLVGKVEFSYATLTGLSELFAAYFGPDFPYQPPTVAAWSGPAGPEGVSKKLGKVELPWCVSLSGSIRERFWARWRWMDGWMDRRKTTPHTFSLTHTRRTSGNVTYAFKRAVLHFDGIAQSITFAPPILQGNQLPILFAIDDVVVRTPAGEAAALAANKALAVEEAVATKVDAARALVTKVGDLKSGLTKKGEE